VSGFCAGLAGGVAFLVKPVVLPIIPIYLAWGYFSHRRLKTRTFISSAAALVCALALLVAPWVVRNYKYSGRLLLTPTMGGYQFLLLYNDSNLDFMSYSLPGFVNELYPGFPDSVLPGLKVNIRDPSVPPLCAEYLQDQAYARSATHFVKTHPRHFFRALPRSFWNMWRITYPIAIPLRKMSDFVFYGAMIPFFFLGVYNVLKKRNIQALLIVAFFIYFIAFHIALASMIRYRITVMPLFFVLAAYGLAEIWEKVARKYGYARNLNNHPHI
jgi:hypothetical protein